MTDNEYDQQKVGHMGSHPPSEGCNASDQCDKPIGFLVDLKKLKDLITGKWKWGWR